MAPSLAYDLGNSQMTQTCFNRGRHGYFISSHKTRANIKYATLLRLLLVYSQIVGDGDSTGQCFLRSSVVFSIKTPMSLDVDQSVCVETIKRENAKINALLMVYSHQQCNGL